MSCCCDLSCFAADGVFPLHLSGQQMLEKNNRNAHLQDVTCRTRVVLYFDNHCCLACFCCSAGLQSGGQGIIHHYHFFFLKNHTNSSICRQRKCRRSDVGCCYWSTARPAPAAVQGRSVSCIYIYISIYLYIYICFFFPSLSSVTVHHSWDVGVESENPE